MRHCFEDIPGRFSDAEGDTIRAAIRGLRDYAICVEIGCWLGRSTAFTAVEIINTGKRIDFFAIDTWRGAQSEREQLATVAKWGGSAFPQFWENMRSRGLQAVVQPIIASPPEASQRFANASIDFVFIDGEHTFQSVRSDTSLWLPKLKAGGTIAGYDVDCGMVIAAVQDVIPASRIVAHNNVWRYTIEPVRGKWIAPIAETESGDLPPHLLYIPWVNRPDLVTEAADSIMTSGLRLFVIDNSDGSSPPPQLPKSAGIFRPAMPLTFTQTQNFAIDQAIHRRAEWLIFMHNDAAGDSELILDLLRFARCERAHHRVGVVFTAYDAVAAFNVDAIRDVGPWDETWKWYYSDIDYYRRMRLRGWAVIDSPFGRRVCHEISTTIKSDASTRRLDDEGRYSESHYNHKWGGPNGSEKYSTPYNGCP